MKLPTAEDMLAEARAGVWPSPHHQPKLHWHALRDILLFIGMEAQRLDVSIGDYEPGKLCQDLRHHLVNAQSSANALAEMLDDIEARRDAA